MARSDVEQLSKQYSEQVDLTMHEWRDGSYAGMEYHWEKAREAYLKAEQARHDFDREPLVVAAGAAVKKAQDQAIDLRCKALKWRISDEEAMWAQRIAQELATMLQVARWTFNIRLIEDTMRTAERFTKAMTKRVED